jgi:hypothetical protein
MEAQRRRKQEQAAAEPDSPAHDTSRARRLAAAAAERRSDGAVEHHKAGPTLSQTSESGSPAGALCMPRGTPPPPWTPDTAALRLAETELAEAEKHLAAVRAAHPRPCSVYLDGPLDGPVSMLHSCNWCGLLSCVDSMSLARDGR